MRQQLEAEFPDIIFHQPINANQSLIVTSRHTPLRNIISEEEAIVTQGESSSSPATTTTDEFKIQGPTYHTSQIAEMYHVASHLNSEVRLCNNTRTVPWPPHHTDFNLEKCQNAIPPVLFNHMALILGFVDAHHTSPERASFSYFRVHGEARRRLISICQDILFFQSRGTKPTQKAIALGMTIRHLTGSKHLTQVLSGFGQSISYDSVLRAETALAVKQATAVNAIPAGFSKHKFTVLVYDNIDFAEETITGAGTTHHTNGIMIQLKQQDIPVVLPNDTAIPRTHVRSYQPAPSNIQPFFITNKQGPQNLSAADNIQLLQQSEKLVREAKMMDKTFILLKSQPVDPALPGWTAYNISVTNPLPLSAVHYLPVIDASPTQLSTVKHILDDAMAYADKLECDQIMVVFDQAIYMKAQMIRWADKSYEQRLVIRLGEFHTVMCFLSAIGKRYKLSGMEDILIDANVVAHGSMVGVLSGHNYNRSIRAHKQLFEALSRLQALEFISTLDEESQQQCKDMLSNAGRHYTAEKSVPSTPELRDILNRFDDYVKTRSLLSPTYRFWTSYLDMVGTLLCFVRATRTSNWDLHLASLRSMLPWMFAYDRTNYSRYAIE